MPATLSRNQVYGYTVLVLSAVIWGAEGVLVKLCYSDGFSIASLTSLRYLLALPVFALFARLYRSPLLPPRAVWGRMSLLSINVVAGVATLYAALSLLPAALAILFFYAYPSFTSILYLLLRRGSLGASRVAALIISALGLALLYWSSAAGISVLGVGCALLSAALQAGKLFQTAAMLKHISSWTLNFTVALFTSVVYSLFYLIYAAPGRDGFDLTSVTPSGWLYVLILGMVVTVFGNMFMTLGIHWLGAVDTSLVLLLEPPTTAVLAFLIFGDTLNVWQLLGGVLVLLAVALPPIANIRLTLQTPTLERR